MAGSMERWIGKPAIVTGASSGIGYAIAEHLVDAGVTVIGVARGKEKLDALKNNLQGKKGIIHTFQADISKEEDILNLFKWVKENVGPIHILINNASVFRMAKLTECKTEFFKEILDIQVLGLCIATREAVQDMRANKVDGHIIHMNAVDGHRVSNFPGLNICPASKFAVTALTETLRNELISFGSKIKVSSISPGYVAGTNAMKDAADANGEAECIIPAEVPHLETRDVANAVIYVLATPPHVQIHEMIIRPVEET